MFMATRVPTEAINVVHIDGICECFNNVFATLLL